MMWKSDSSWYIREVDILNSLWFSKAQGKTKQKLRRNCNFFANLVFDKIDFDFWCNLKTNDRNS